MKERAAEDIKRQVVYRKSLEAKELMKKNKGWESAGGK